MSTKIAWTQETWNPVTGCSRVSEGCRHCYAETLSLARGWSTLPWTHANAAKNVILHPERLNKPLAWKKPAKIFVNSMSDLFHPLVPNTFIAQVFDVMRQTPHHIYQILTKRPDRAAIWPGPWLPHIWMGTSVENREALYRLESLRTCPALLRFVSFEPLLEDLGPLNLDGYHWVIVGGESGPGYRPMSHTWARTIRDQCVSQQITFFFKQSAGPRTEMGIELQEIDGTQRVWREYPPTKQDLASMVPSSLF